jgi:hypothetical protein
LFLTDDGMTVALREAMRPAPRPGASREEEHALREEARTATVTLGLVGARKGTTRGEDELVTKSNFFLGNDRTRWRTNVPNYARVRATGGIPGVEVVWHGAGEGGGLEYDLEVAAGVDARDIEMDVEGAERLEVASDGSLEIVTAAGTLVEKPPRVVQGGKELPARYALTGANRVRFALDAYDTRLAVLIDPAFAYKTGFLGSFQDCARAIAADGSGNAYVTGDTGSTNFSKKDPLQAA